MHLKKPNPDPVVEYLRRAYLESKGKIPSKLEKVYPGMLETERKLRAIDAKAAKKGKLPERLPEWVYDDLERRIQMYLKMWSFLRRKNDHEVSEQARKRIHKAFEALYLRLDRRQKINILNLWDDYNWERRMVKTVLKALRHVATSNGTIRDWDKRFVALRWDLKKLEVEEIWQQRYKWRPLVRERLAHQYQVSLERLNRLIPISRKANNSALKTRVSREKGFGSMADSLIERETLKKYFPSLSKIEPRRRH